MVYYAITLVMGNLQYHLKLRQQFSNEEGYDVPEDEYMEWLKENHPDHVTDQGSSSS